MMYSFVLEDSLTSYRFTTRTEQLTKCCEPLQKMRMRLEPCKTGLSPPSNFILLIVPRRYFCYGSNVLCFGVDFLCCLSLMHVFIFQFSPGN